FWFRRVLSAPACAAATPTPGTTIAWMSISPFRTGGKRPCGTQVAEEIATCRVAMSTAMIDQVAEAAEGAAASASSARNRGKRDHRGNMALIGSSPERVGRPRARRAGGRCEPRGLQQHRPLLRRCQGSTHFGFRDARVASYTSRPRATRPVPRTCPWRRMFAVDGLILIAGILLLLGIASSKFSAQVG